MILPTKHISIKRSLVYQGSILLSCLATPMGVSEIWSKVKEDASVLGFDNFILTLDMLFLIGAIEIREGLVARRST